jgi:hypothetical protein
MNCTAARFPKAAAQGTQPVRDSEIVVTDIGNNPIGVGFTDRNGQYVVQWETNPGVFPNPIRFKWRLRHKDGRFRVTDANDAIWVGIIDELTPVFNDTVAADPVTFPFSEPTNIYDGAQRTWWEAFQNSGLMLSRFTDVRLRWPDTLAAANNATANGSQKRVSFNGNNAERPQARVSHEMGHIASYLAEPFTACLAYNYPTQCIGADPGTNCSGGWSLNGPEHYCQGFEEALATYLGDASYYGHWALEPKTCNSTGPCTGNFNLETSVGSGCTPDQKHTVMNAERYLWDVYDSINDPGFTDTVNITYWQMIAHLDEFLTTVANGGINEPWNSAITEVNDQDGRSSRDYRKYVDPDTSVLYSKNCSPGGD